MWIDTAHRRRIQHTEPLNDRREDSGVYLALLLVTIWLLAEIGLPLLDHLLGGR